MLAWGRVCISVTQMGENWTVDYVEGLHVPTKDYGGAIPPLKMLWFGMSHIYERVKSAQATERGDVWTSVATLAYKADERIGREPYLLVYSMFHWYSVSACNLVGLIGRVLIDSKQTEHKRPSGYVDEIIPSVKLWRNKIGAHFAVTTPTKRDSDAMKGLSIYNSIRLRNGVIEVVPLQVRMQDGGRRSEAELKRWALTEVHEQLDDRFRLDLSE